MIIHLTGADTFRSARRLAELRAAFVTKHDPRGFNTVTIDGQSMTLEALRTALTTSGFFSAKRFVAIDRYLPDGPVKAEELIGLLVPLAAKDHDVIVVLRDLIAGVGHAPKKARLGKKRSSPRTAAVVPVIAGEKLESFPQFTDGEAVQWLLQEAKRNGGSIEPHAAQRLVTLCGRDMWRMSSELTKLLMYCGDRVVLLADVEAMVKSQYASDIFALTDALGQRQTARALDLIHRELASGTNAFALIATAASHIRNLWQVKRALERGSSSAAIASELGIHPFVVQKAVAQVPKFTVEELLNIHHRLLHIDNDLKTSPLEAETLLDLLVIHN